MQLSLRAGGGGPLPPRRPDCDGMNGYLCLYVGLRLSQVFQLFLQDPVMPSQEPPSDAQRQEVEPPADETEDADDSETLHLHHSRL